MRIGTTPTHEFTLTSTVDEVKEVEITYHQNNREILKKRIDDCEINGNRISTTLTQEETFMFTPNMNVEIQIRVLDVRGTVVGSDIVMVSCQRCLSDEVLK